MYLPFSRPPLLSVIPRFRHSTLPKAPVSARSGARHVPAIAKRPLLTGSRLHPRPQSRQPSRFSGDGWGLCRKTQHENCSMSSDYDFFIKPWLKIFEQTLIAIFQPEPDWKLFIAITISFEKLIRINRTLIEIFPANPDCEFSTGPWLKTFHQTLILNFQPDRDWKIPGRLWFRFFNQTLIENFSSRSRSRLKNWSGSIEPWLKFSRHTLIANF